MKPKLGSFSSLLLGSAAVIALTVAAAAQTAGVQTGVTAGGTAEFRDAKTGKVWTPENVSKDNQSPAAAANQVSTPSDKAFDPNAQVTTSTGIEVQRPRANVMGLVPITAGPNVPLVTIDGPTLQAVPGQRWLTALYVTNNSGEDANAQVGCTFTNGGRSVLETRIIVPTAGPGQRLGVPAYGPRTDIFVDRVLCRVLTP
ncbi:hypothetical protein BH11PSE3_BH11PSE3_18280 [soil metagenome]